MKLDLADRRRRYYLLGGLALLAGLLAAALIYLEAQRQEDLARQDPASYSSLMLMNPEYSKRFLRDLEVYGGKANVLMFRIRLWLEQTFSGKSLAGIVAGLGILTAAALFYAGGRRTRPGPPPAGPGPGQT